MLLKVYDFLKSILWYIVSFVYDLIDALVKIIKELNAFDIINSLSKNSTFQNFYKGICTIAVTLLALFIIFKFVNKMLEPDSEITIKAIAVDSVKCTFLVLLSTFIFAQVSNFSITLANYTSNIFEINENTSMSKSLLTMFVSYNSEYKKSDKFKEDKTISELINSGDFGKDELYLEKYVSKDKIIFDDKDYKYEVNWILALLCGGFFLYAMIFAAMMLGRRQIEFLFLFAISPIIFATGVCNKQRRSAVYEQMTSLVLQSAVIMLIVSLTILVMQQINVTTFFTNNTMDIVMKVLLYLGCATFILTGSQVINKFIGANVSAANGREQLMSLMGYGKLATAGAVVGGATVAGGALLGAGLAMKGGRFAKNTFMSNVGAAMGTYGAPDSYGNQSRMQKVASTIGTRMYAHGQRGFQKSRKNSGGFHASDAFMNAGANSINSAVRRVMPRAGYNPSYYRRRNKI